MRSRLGKALLCACLLAVGTAATADNGAAAHERAVEQVKYDALMALRESLTREVDAQFPTRSRVSVYLEAPVAQFVLREVSLRVDTGEPIVKKYTRKQALALLERGADRLLRFNAAPGTHRLTLEFSGALERPNGQDLVIDDTLELEFETKPNSQAFIMPAAPKILRPVRTFSDLGERATWNWKSVADDPRLDYVRYLWDTDRYLPGLMELLRAAGPANTDEPSAPGFDTLMAEAYLNFGMRDHAKRSAMAARDSEPEPTALTHVWLQLAQLDYKNGNYAGAAYAMAQISADAPEAQQADFLDLRARIFMAQGEYGQAAALLGGIANPAPLLRYNHAVALIKSGNTARGRAELNAVGADQASEARLRERASLVLAYHLLDQAGGDGAKSALQRLPLNGPYANSALLALGWAEIAGAQDNPDASRLRRALAAWELLASRDRLDPAVQEALISLPYAHEQLGRYERAVRGYQNAIDAYTQIAGQLRGAAKRLRQGNFREAILSDDAGSLPRTGNPERIFNEGRFRAHAQNYRHLKGLQLAVAEHDGPKRLRDRLEQAAEQEIVRAHEAIAASVDQQIRNLEQYLIDARLGLVRNSNRLKSSGQRGS